VSAVMWASTLHCDYPGCQSVADVHSADEVPAGWLILDYRKVNLEARSGSGVTLRDFCSLHSGITLAKLAEATRQQMEAG
jgi:hypothetical protein